MLYNTPPTVDTLATILDRVARFMDTLIARLRVLNFDVATTESYLEGYPGYPIPVISSVNHLSIKMELAPVVPLWSQMVRLRLRLVCDRKGSKPKFWHARRDGTLAIGKVLSHIISEVRLVDVDFHEAQAKERLQRESKESFSLIASKVGVSENPNEPLTISHGNYKVRRLINNPTMVAVVITVSHKQAVDIISKYGRK